MAGNLITLASWFGGKADHLRFLLPLLPATEKFVEPFGGSGVVLMNRPRSPVEVYGDLFEPAVNLLAVVRDSADDLAEAMRLTPYSRTEYSDALRMPDGLDDIEKARRFLVVTRQQHTPTPHVMDKWSAHSWSRSVSHESTRIRRTESMVVRSLPAASKRLQGVEIWWADAAALVADHDSPDTLFYLDPPYVADLRAPDFYGEYEMTDDQHRELGELLNSIDGKAAVSGYPCSLYDDELFTAKRGWRRIDDTSRKVLHTSRRKQTECLWVNYA